jgi:hypothetical protein
VGKMTEKNKIYQHQVIVNREMQVFLSDLDNYKKLTSAEKILKNLNELVKYEVRGMFEAEPSAKEMYDKFCIGKDAVIKEIVKQLITELDDEVKRRIFKREFLKLIEEFKASIIKLSARAYDKEFLTLLLPVIDKTILTVSTSPEEIDASVLVIGFLKRLN